MTVELKEREKYEKMWSVPAYRNWSPGLDAVEFFLKHTPMIEGDSIIDLGCGTGRAAVALAKSPLRPRVVLLDFCPIALEQDAYAMPFFNACLWRLPSNIGRYDWIFCVDVLEHIPPDHVNEVLDNMAKITKHGGFLQICTVPDGCGSMIGEKLHLTVESAEWWSVKIKERWKVYQMIVDGVNVRFLLGGPHGSIRNNGRR
jgi:2-polyprenyl-3-methyl-5-hydroxy-6-metoxy-1,4-benzoquinol methylase